MTRSRVAVLKCSSYSLEEVKKNIRRGFGLLGGLNRFIKSGEKILLKPNILSGVDPSKTVTVHPSVFEAVASAVQQEKAYALFGDSPGIATTTGCALIKQ